MRVYVNEEKKRVEIWLTRGESVHDDIKEAVSGYCMEKYLTVIFRSGERDLAEMTGMLLKDSRN